MGKGDLQKKALENMKSVMNVDLFMCICLLQRNTHR